jgi:hypothetical protein
MTEHVNEKNVEKSTGFLHVRLKIIRLTENTESCPMQKRYKFCLVKKWA